MTHKYGAKPLWYDVNADTVYQSVSGNGTEYRKLGYEYFASQLEYETFRQIRAFCRQKRLTHEILHQCNVELLPQDKGNKEITWNIDFKLSYSLSGDWQDKEVLYIEAKGFELDDYKLKVQLLKRFKPSIYQQLRVVKDSRKVATLLRKEIFNNGK